MAAVSVDILTLNETKSATLIWWGEAIGCGLFGRPQSFLIDLSPLFVGIVDSPSEIIQIGTDDS